MLPTPPEAPVTRTGPSPGTQALVLEPVQRERGGEAGGADGGGPPRASRPAGRGTTQSAGTRASWAKPPWWATPRS